MDIVSVLTIILSMVGINLIFFIFLLNRMDSGFKELRKDMQKIREELMSEIHKNKEELMSEIHKNREELRSEIHKNKEELMSEIHKNKEEVLWIKFRLDPHEHPQKIMTVQEPQQEK